jgi:hypothetical protein
MNLEDITKSEYFDSAIMPYGMKITHLPTGLSVQGNCKHEQSKLQMERTLVDTLGIFVAQAESQDASLKRKSKAEQENDTLKATLAAMQAQLDRLTAMTNQPIVVEKPKNGQESRAETKETPQPVVKKRGRPAKAKPALVDTPQGPVSEEEFIKRALRPATDRPQPLPKAHQSHGATVVKVSDESMAKGFRP